MTIKKFQGKTQEEATEKARQELGAGAVVMNVKEIKPKGLFNFFKGSTFEVTAAIEEKEQFLNAVQMAAMQQKKIENINLAADEKISIPLPAEKTVEPAPSYQRPVTPEKEVVVNKSESDIEKKHFTPHSGGGTCSHDGNRADGTVEICAPSTSASAMMMILS